MQATTRLQQIYQRTRAVKADLQETRDALPSAETLRDLADHLPPVSGQLMAAAEGREQLDSGPCAVTVRKVARFIQYAAETKGMGLN
jgi:hypothetical protein